MFGHIFTMFKMQSAFFQGMLKKGPENPPGHLFSYLVTSRRVVNGMVVNTWCKKVHPAKGDGGDGHVAKQEEGVGDAQGGEQQVEHIVHLPESHQC